MQRNTHLNFSISFLGAFDRHHYHQIHIAVRPSRATGVRAEQDNLLGVKLPHQAADH